MIGYHCTTKKKLRRYQQTTAILPPVRFWLKEPYARAWMEKTHRDVLLKISTTDEKSYPLPDHKPRGMAYWADELIREWEEIVG